MAAVVQQPLSATPQIFHHYTSRPATGSIMPDDRPIAPVLQHTNIAHQAHHDTSPYHSSPTIKKRRISKGRLPPELIKRSSSTPQMRNLTAVEGDSLSPTADKKRNKLGYHRTSVACGHCRRRKIRCLPAPDDPQGRCSNCIRLKKECNFYPVDQEAQHQPGKSSTSGSKASLASNPSSPRTIATPSHESMEDYNAKYRNVPSSTPNARFVLSSDQDGSTPSSSGNGGIYPPPSTLPTHINPYGDTVEEPWNSAYYPPPMGGDARFDPHNSAFWRPNEQDSTGAYDHDNKAAGGYSQPRIGSVSGIPYTTADESQSWTVPARSMSYGNLEDASHQYSHQPSPQHQQQRQNTHPTRGAVPAVQYSHPHTLGSNVATATAASMAGSATMTAPSIAGAHGAMPNYGYTQAWNPMYTQPTAGSDPSLHGPAYPHHYYAEPGTYQQPKGQHQYADGTANYYQPPDQHIMR